MNKYHAKKCEYNGIVFDSIAEKNRYIDLLMLEKAGQISKIGVHPRQEIISKTIKGTRTHYYTADFEYIEKGCIVYEDVKGRKVRDYSLRRDLFIHEYVVGMADLNVIFREVTNGKIKEFRA